jgi:hypothetical protein
MTKAESYMPDIFRSMAGKSDTAILQELYIYVTKMYISRKRQPFAGADVWRFLSTRATAERVQKLLEMAIKSQVIVDSGDNSDRFVPGRDISLQT